MKDPFEALDRVAHAPVLLIASDYDGTLSPIVADPMKAFPLRETMVALKALAAIPNTHVALISGRALRDLAVLTGSPDSMHLVGSHGSEFDPGFASSLPPEATHLLERVTEQLQEIADSDPDAAIETKPASVAFHYRNVSDPELGERMAHAVTEGPGSWTGVYPKKGKKVIELSVVATDKGSAVETIRQQVGASVAIYLGDDVTDEDAFRKMRGPDLSIKVGVGATEATTRLADTHEVARFLAALAERRGGWLTGAEATPIERHSLLSDQRTLALVDDHARVTWFCAPRLDSHALFAELVGGPTAGYFAVQPVQSAGPPEQEYEQSSMVLTSRWPGIVVRDCLECSEERAAQRSGRTDLVRSIEGQGRVCIEFAPSLDFGRTETLLRVIDGGLMVEDAPEPIVLRSPGVTWELCDEGAHQIARAEVELTGEPLVLELRYGTGSTEPMGDVAARLRATTEYWQKWTRNLQIPEGVTPLVERSALILKALCYTPTGAIAAAATTSLPESIGGVRNWDYRYCWIRDGAHTAIALADLGSLNEGMRFLDWTLDVVGRLPGFGWLRPVYTVTGDELGIEAEIAELPGYAGARPVRIGNGAARQLQLDVYGPLLALVARLFEKGAAISADHWRLVKGAVAAVEQRWAEPDHGIWEVRGPRRHFVHSKVMCWLAVDRAIAISQGYHGRVPDGWPELRARIGEEVLERGWKDAVNSYVAAYDGTDLDASVLEIGLCGLLPPEDPRFVGTVTAIERYLREEGSVYRYHYDDGLPGREGAFLLCASWLVDSYVLVDRLDEAQELFEELCERAGPTGLMAEEYEPERGIALGNVPQAYSHLGLIHNALRIHRATST